MFSAATFHGVEVDQRLCGILIVGVERTHDFIGGDGLPPLSDGEADLGQLTPQVELPLWRPGLGCFQIGHERRAQCFEIAGEPKEAHRAFAQVSIAWGQFLGQCKQRTDGIDLVLVHDSFELLCQHREREVRLALRLRQARQPQGQRHLCRNQPLVSLELEQAQQHGQRRVGALRGLPQHRTRHARIGDARRDLSQLPQPRRSVLGGLRCARQRGKRGGSASKIGIALGRGRQPGQGEGPRVGQRLGPLRRSGQRGGERGAGGARGQRGIRQFELPALDQERHTRRRFCEGGSATERLAQWPHRPQAAQGNQLLGGWEVARVLVERALTRERGGTPRGRLHSQQPRLGQQRFGARTPWRARLRHSPLRFERVGAQAKPLAQACHGGEQHPAHRPWRLQSDRLPVAQQRVLRPCELFFPEHRLRRQQLGGQPKLTARPRHLRRPVVQPHRPDPLTRALAAPGQRQHALEVVRVLPQGLIEVQPGARHIVGFVEQEPAQPGVGAGRDLAILREGRHAPQRAHRGDQIAAALRDLGEAQQGVDVVRDGALPQRVGAGRQRVVAAAQRQLGSPARRGRRCKEAPLGQRQLGQRQERVGGTQPLRLRSRATQGLAEHRLHPQRSRRDRRAPREHRAQIERQIVRRWIAHQQLQQALGSEGVGFGLGKIGEGRARQIELVRGDQRFHLGEDPLALARQQLTCDGRARRQRLLLELQHELAGQHVGPPQPHSRRLRQAKAAWHQQLPQGRRERVDRELAARARVAPQQWRTRLGGKAMEELRRRNLRGLVEAKVVEEETQGLATASRRVAHLHRQLCRVGPRDRVLAEEL